MSHSTHKAISTTICSIIALLLFLSIVILTPGAYAAESTAASKSDVQLAYETAIDIDVSDLDVSPTGTYSYKGMNVLRSDVDGLIGTKLGQGAIYNGIAKQLDGFYVFGEDMYGMWNSSISKTVFGFAKLDSWDEMRNYVDRAKLMIDLNYPVGEILSEFHDLSVSSGSFDFENREFDFQIDNLEIAARELDITEEMLGYIFAMLDVYGATTEFDGNECAFQLKYRGRDELIEQDFTYNDGYQGIETTFSLDGDDLLIYVGYDTEGLVVPEDSTNGYSSFRGVQLMHSMDAVTLSYGRAEYKKFIAQDDFMYMNIGEDPIRPILDAYCKNYMGYNYEDKGQIISYFDENDQVICVVYTQGILYNIAKAYDKETITLVQEKLNQDGYNCGVPDGVIGAKTTAALKNYQKIHDLNADGMISDELLAIMGIVSYDADSQPTTGEKNALRSAGSYLDTMPFSYNGLIEQLEYEGYSHSEAVYGADNCGADWNEQAVKMAASYLDTMSFSRTGLIEQLEYEGFTHDQAVYGVEQNGY